MLWDACAVIAHDSRQVAALEAELAARDVPTASGQGRALGETRAVRDLLTLVDLAARDKVAQAPDNVSRAQRFLRGVVERLADHREILGIGRRQQVADRLDIIGDRGDRLVEFMR